MLRLDKIKLISDIKNIEIIDKTAFELKGKSKNIIECTYYNSKHPGMLYISQNLKNEELVLEFTGKILVDAYPQLINKFTIRTCLENINALQICKLDVDAILMDSVVVKADVTKDVTCDNIPQLNIEIKANIKNYSKYICRIVRGTLVVEKNVVTRRNKLRLSVYDKEKEMATKKNAWLNEQTQAYFDSKVRFELNVNSINQLKNTLEINDTKLDTVLNASANPIWNFLDEILIKESHPTSARRLNEYLRLLLLKECNYDLAQVEPIVKMYSGAQTHITQIMKPYRDLVAKMKNYSNNTFRNEMQTLLC